MKLLFSIRTLLTLAILLAMRGQCHACAACLGNSDSAMAEGMNWGIMTLLVVVLSVLVGIAAFFIYLARRSAMVASSPDLGQLSEPSKKFA